MDPPTVFWTPKIQDANENPRDHQNHQGGVMACSNTYPSTPQLSGSWKILKYHHLWWAWDTSADGQRRKPEFWKESFPSQAVWAASPYFVVLLQAGVVSM